MPLCACGALPLADALRKRGAGAALVVAFLSWVRSLQLKVKTLRARPSSPARQLASLMLMLWALNVWLTIARMPGLFVVVTLSWTGRLILAFESQLTDILVRATDSFR